MSDSKHPIPEPDRDMDAVEEVPAGGAGADSGAVGAVAVDAEGEAEIANTSAMNDEPGVGTRGPNE